MEVLSDSEESIEFDPENDEDLQEAYAQGILQPGLVKPGAPSAQRKICINNVKGMKRKLEKIKFNAPWIERLDLTNGPAPLAPELAEKLKEEKESQQKSTSTSLDTVSNDFERELGFYRQAQASILEGLPRLQSLGLPTRRPDDYMAEMAKTDEHMQKVRETLTKKQTEEERREKIRQFRQLKKFGKKVQAENRVAKAAQKKTMLDEVKKFRKGQRKDLDFLDDDDTKKKPPKKKARLDYNPTAGQQQGKGKIKRSQMRRQAKDQKYGQGGRKRGKKANTRDSASDVFGRGGDKKGGKKAGGKPQKTQGRPGKSKRQKLKSRKK